MVELQLGFCWGFTRESPVDGFFQLRPEHVLVWMGLVWGLDGCQEDHITHGNWFGSSLVSQQLHLPASPSPITSMASSSCTGSSLFDILLPAYQNRSISQCARGMAQ